ncbi:MAG: hypothetical protein E7568_02615, partial [Ruminococcaceae bacterium]|nr:hypothetical protein [Oscillospiraceae bacterium]
MMNKKFSFLNNLLGADTDYKKLISCIQSAALPVACTGLSDIHKSVITACVGEKIKSPLVVITSG